MDLDQLLDRIDEKLMPESMRARYTPEEYAARDPYKDEDWLTPEEFAVLDANNREYAIRTQGFYSFLDEAGLDAFEKAISALQKVGEEEYSRILRKFLRDDGASYEAMLAGTGPTFVPSRDYDAAFTEVRQRYGRGDDGYMRAILTDYARKSGLLD